MGTIWTGWRETVRVSSCGGCVWGLLSVASGAGTPAGPAGGNREIAGEPIAEVLRAPDGSSTFGGAVAADGEWIAVGDDRAADGLVESGRVHLHRRDGGARWNRIETISGRDRRPFDRFGHAVAMSGDRLIVGAPGPDGVGGGRAEVFRRRQGRWRSEAVLEDPAVGPLDRFGAAVAIAGDLAVVAAPRRDAAALDAGAVAVFTRTAAGWSEATWLEAPDAAAGDWFGSSVATDGDRVVVGVVGDDDLGEKSGAAWVFRRDDGDWWPEAKLLPPHGAAREWFGHAVGVAGERVLVGAPRADPQGSTSGTVWAFARDPFGWSVVSEVPAPDGRPGDWFGTDLAIEGSIAIVGRPGRDLRPDGSELEDLGDAVVLSRSGRRWRSDGVLQPGVGEGVRLRGSAVAISEVAFVLGHRPVEDGPVVPGEVWVVPRR